MDKLCVGVYRTVRARMQGAEGENKVRTGHSHVHIEQYRLADPLNLGNDAFEVERLCEHDFEDLLHVDRCGCRAKDE